MYCYLVISLLCASYNLFNLKAFDISQTLLFNVILLPFVLLLSIYYGSNYNKAKKVYDITSGLFVGILIVLLLITTSALLYKVFKIKKIQEENERIYDLYSYYVDFNSLESGYSYRIDDKTGYLYHIDEENNKVEEIRPTYFHKLNKDYEFKVYRVEKGYAVINGMDTYFTKSLNSNSKVYKIKYPLEKIKKKYRDEEYYKLDGDKFNIIDAIKFARKIGYKVLPVNVNKSKSIFTFDDVKREIYFPFKSIKGVSEEAGKVIEKAAPFVDFNDFLLKTKSKVINKRIITPLIELRGFDDLNCKEQIRDYYLENFSLSKEEDTSLRNSFKKDSEKKLLTKEERAKYKEELKQKAIAVFEQMYQTPLSMYELKHLGFILSIDLKKYENLLKDQVNPNMVEDDSTVFLYGFLSDIKNMKSKKGNYYGLIQIIDQNFNNFEIITKAITIDNILQREQYKVRIGDFIRITVTKKGGRFFLKNEELIALNDCL